MKQINLQILLFVNQLSLYFGIIHKKYLYFTHQCRVCRWQKREDGVAYVRYGVGREQFLDAILHIPFLNK